MYSKQACSCENLKHATLSPKLKWCTVEPRFNEPLFNEVLDITNEILRPGQSYRKMYGIDP